MTSISDLAAAAPADLIAHRARVERQPALRAVLTSGVFMVSLDSRVVSPLLPTVAEDYHISIARAGWLVSAYLLPYGLCQLAYGPLADRFGKITVSAYAMVAFSVGTALCGTGSSFGTILCVRALTGAAAAALIPLTLAYVGDTVAYDKRQAAIASLMAASGAAQAFGTSAGGVIAVLISWRTVFPVLGVLAGVVTVGLFVLRHSELPAPRHAGSAPRYRDVVAAPQLRALLVLVGLEGFLFFGGFSYLSGLLYERFALSALAIGMILGLAGLSQLVAARLLPSILPRASERTFLLSGGALLGAAYLASALARSWAWIACACVAMGAGFILCHSTLQTRATEAFPRARGTAVALFAFALFLGSGVGTLAYGASISWVGYTATFSAGGLLLLAFTSVVVRVLGLRPDAST